MSAIWRVGLNHVSAKNKPSTFPVKKSDFADDLKDSTSARNLSRKSQKRNITSYQHNDVKGESLMHHHLEYFRNNQIEATEAVMKLLQQYEKREEQQQEDHKENRPLSKKDNCSAMEYESVFTRDHLLVKHCSNEGQKDAPLFIAVAAQLSIMCVTGGDPDRINRCISPEKKDVFHFPTLSLEQCHKPLGRGMGCIMGLLNCFKQVIDEQQLNIKNQQALQPKPHDIDGDIYAHKQAAMTRHTHQKTKTLQSMGLREYNGCDDDEMSFVDPSVVMHQITKTAFLAGSRIGRAFNLIKRGDDGTKATFAAALLQQPQPKCIAETLDRQNTYFEDNISSLAVESLIYSGVTRKYPFYPFRQNSAKRARTEDEASCDYSTDQR
jgi:hypothetical protein